MKKRREIAKVHIARCEAGDMQAIKELGDRLDGKPAQILEHSGPDSNPIKKIIREIVFMPPPGQNVTIENVLPADDGNGKDGKLVRLPPLCHPFAEVAKDMKAGYSLVWIRREMRPVVDPAEADFLIGDEQRCPGLCPRRAR